MAPPPQLPTSAISNPMEMRRLPSSPRILIVDSSVEARDILSTLLRRQGAETIETAHTATATALLQQQKPDLIVYDDEAAASSSSQEKFDLGHSASRSATPIVVLGTAKRQFSPLPTEHFVTKPYHYGPLIRRIESLLEIRGVAKD